MTATPNNVANPNYVPPAKPAKAKTEKAARKQALPDVRFEVSYPKPVQSAVYESADDLSRRRLLLDNQVLMIPEGAHISVDVRGDGGGVIRLTIPASQLQVIKAGNRIGRRRSRRSEKKN